MATISTSLIFHATEPNVLAVLDGSCRLGHRSPLRLSLHDLAYLADLFRGLGGLDRRRRCIPARDHKCGVLPAHGARWHSAARLGVPRVQHVPHRCDPAGVLRALQRASNADAKTPHPPAGGLAWQQVDASALRASDGFAYSERARARAPCSPSWTGVYGERRSLQSRGKPAKRKPVAAHRVVEISRRGARCASPTGRASQRDRQGSRRASTGKH